MYWGDNGFYNIFSIYVVLCNLQSTIQIAEFNFVNGLCKLQLLNAPNLAKYRPTTPSLRVILIPLPPFLMIHLVFDISVKMAF